MQERQGLRSRAARRLDIVRSKRPAPELGDARLNGEGVAALVRGHDGRRCSGCMESASARLFVTLALRASIGVVDDRRPVGHAECALTVAKRKKDGMSFVLLVLRAVIATIFMGHGAQKVLGKFGGYGPDGTGQFFESIGLRPGKPMALAAGGNEMTSGALIGLGLATPAAAAGLM